jgi:hypothetical protein
MRARQPHTPHPEESPPNPCALAVWPREAATSRHVFSPYGGHGPASIIRGHEHERHDAVPVRRCFFRGHHMPCRWRRLTASERRRAAAALPCGANWLLPCTPPVVPAASGFTPVLSYEAKSNSCVLFHAIPQYKMDRCLLVPPLLRLSCDELTQENETIVGRASVEN